MLAGDCVRVLWNQVTPQGFLGPVQEGFGRPPYKTLWQLANNKNTKSETLRVRLRFKVSTCRGMP